MEKINLLTNTKIRKQDNNNIIIVLQNNSTFFNNSRHFRSDNLLFEFANPAINLGGWNNGF